MFKFNALLVLAFLLFSAQAFACKCAGSALTDNFQQAQFVAKVKLVEIVQDVSNADYHDAKIQTLTLYKGQALTRIKIHSNLNSSCGFLPKVNSTWVVFASEWQGKLSFHYCSGSFDVKGPFETFKSAPGRKAYINSSQIKTQVLDVLHLNHIRDPNPGKLSVTAAGLESIKGYKNSNHFAVFQLSVNADFSISKVSSMNKFSNRRLQNAVLKTLKQAAVGSGLPEGKALSTPTRVIVVVYFHEESNPKRNFVTLYEI